MKLKDSKLLLTSAMNPTSSKNAVTLLSTTLMLVPSVHFIAAVTKQGKTNFAANLVASTLDTKSGKIFVGLNEETAEDFVVRVACIKTGLSFPAWKSGKFTEQQRETLGRSLVAITERVVFADEETTNLGCFEDAVKIIRQAANSEKVSLVVFDYLQNVYLSREYPGKSQYELSKLFGVRLKDIGKTAVCPVVVFGQLKENNEAGFKSRVEGDSWFVNNVATGIELKAFKHNKQSQLIVQIDRFQGRTHDEFWFTHGVSGKLTQIEKPENTEGQDD